MLKYFVKIPILKRLIPSIGVRLLKLFKKNRGFFVVDGFKMYLDFLDPIDRIIIINQSYEYEEIDTLNRLINKNSIKKFIDIGANCGFYSFKFARQDLKVLSFEPNLEAFFKMQKTLEINKKLKNKIKIYPYGISNANSVMQMRSMIKHGYIQTGGSWVIDKKIEKDDKFKVYDANFKKGDDVLKFQNDKIAIKIDVEGHELSVLHGIRNLLINNKCILQVEIFERNFEEINLYLANNNFNLIDHYSKRFNYFYSNF
jgi:FkbM family methyltransferase